VRWPWREKRQHRNCHPEEHKDADETAAAVEQEGAAHHIAGDIGDEHLAARLSRRR
jgi:hypothetical protein